MTQGFLKRRVPFLLLALLLLGLAALAACAGPTPTPEPTATPTEVPTAVPTTEPPTPEVALEIPFEDEWASSGHADAEAEAFIHWDEDDPPEVPTRCAKCHSTPGYHDFLGIDGTAAGVVDNAAPIGSVVTCVACHNEATLVMDSVTFPSGVEVAGLGREARCMQCHQGRESTVSVDEAIAEVGVDEDTVSEDLGFKNIHYFAAAVSQYGGLAMGGYQYEGKSYDTKFAHVEGSDSCVRCHDSHTLEPKVEACSTCHIDVVDREELVNVRMEGSLVDYDGDGDLTEGIKDEIEGLREMLYQAIQNYGSEVSGTPTVYDAERYPYWFTDTDDRYNAWTARLVKASYNYQVSLKDPGAYAHGGKYIIQLLYDSIEDLNAALSDPIDLTSAHRIDPGHFAGSEEAFRHWDEDGEVPGRCSKCHSATGLPFFLKEGVSVSEPLSNGFLCTTCHDSLPEFTRYAVEEVEFPSGAVVSFGEAADSNLCLSCHQGRESTVSVDKATAGLDDDTVSDKLRFINVHYYAAGATLFGTEAQGAYEYEGKSYLGRFAHVEPLSQCTQCHDTHALEVQVEACGACHAGVESEEDLESIRMSTEDFDGDGDATEGIAGEIATLHEALYAAMQDYAADVVGVDIVHNAHRYPYWFTDAGERYSTWTPRLVKAAYNYQYVAKDPGSFAHNGRYIIQVLYDSLADLGTKVTVDMTGMVRP